MIGAMDKTFLRRVAALCIPMALQNLINTGVMAADVIMIGRVGEKVLSGASLAGQIYFILNLILFGVCSGASVLIAQYWGKRDLDTIEQVAGIALRITVSTALLFAAVTLMVPSLLMRIFTSDPEVIGYGTEYLRIIALTYPVVAFVSTYLMLIKNIERVVISTVTYLVSLCVNICMNALLIYGLCGFPALGIRGAAIATLTARLTELAIALIVGVFRAGGDTKFGLYMDTGTMWGVSIPLGCIAAFVLHLRPEIVYIILMGDEFLKTPLALARYRKKLWLTNVTRTA